MLSLFSLFFFIFRVYFISIEFSSGKKGDLGNCTYVFPIVVVAHYIIGKELIFLLLLLAAAASGLLVLLLFGPNAN